MEMPKIGSHLGSGVRRFREMNPHATRAIPAHGALDHAQLAGPQANCRARCSGNPALECHTEAGARNIRDTYLDHFIYEVEKAIELTFEALIFAIIIIFLFHIF